MNELNSIRKIHRAYREKTISPTELVTEYLKKMEVSDHNAYLTLCNERALEQAKEAEKILSKGQDFEKKFPLLGIPFGIKDLFTIKGVRTTCASKILENYIPPYTATCVSRLESKGAITLGKTNMDEFAMGSSNENSAFGPVKHPTHPEYVSGGSSGGSAVAVRAGLCVAALGTDTGGSIRLPSNYCGVVGFKPTYGRVSRYGQIAFASSLDQCGPITNTVEDAALILEAMAGVDPMDSTSSPTKVSSWSNEVALGFKDWKNLRVGIPKEYFEEGLNEEVQKTIEDRIEWIKSKGAKIVPISLPHTSYAVPTYYVVAVSEASSNLARFDGVRFGVRPKSAGESGKLEEFYKKVRALFGAEVKRRILLGTFALSSGYYDAYYQRACRVRRLIQNDFLEAFKKIDLIVSPVSPSTAFKRGEKSSDPLQLYLVDILTAPASLAGLPALSIPVGKSRKGLPIGMQLIGPHFGESKILNIANAIEKGMKG